MSFEITTAFVDGFRNNIYMLTQQTDARLFGKSRTEAQNSKTDFYERIGVVEAQEVRNRHGDTPLMNTPHSRRAVTLSDAEFADLVDKLDMIRTLIEPTNAYVKAAISALNRKKDDVFIAAALGTALTGDEGNIPVALPVSQKLVSIDESSGAAKNFSVFLLTKTQEKFDSADVEDGMMRHFAWSSSQKQALLNDTKATSQDFASVRALVSGQINTFMGFNFVRSERLPFIVDPTQLLWENAGGQLLSETGGAAGAGQSAGVAGEQYRRCFAWIEDGMISSIGKDLMARVSERDDKRYSTQIYVCHSVGAVRMEEIKVVEVLCKQN